MSVLCSANEMKGCALQDSHNSFQYRADKALKQTLLNINNLIIVQIKNILSFNIIKRS